MTEVTAADLIQARTDVLGAFETWSTVYPQQNKAIAPFDAWKLLVDTLQKNEAAALATVRAEGYAAGTQAHVEHHRCERCYAAGLAHGTSGAAG